MDLSKTKFVSFRVARNDDFTACFEYTVYTSYNEINRKSIDAWRFGAAIESHPVFCMYAVRNSQQDKDEVLQECNNSGIGYGI